MAQLVFKITQQTPGGTPITRRVPFIPSNTGDDFTRVATLLKDRFALQDDEPLALIWRDAEGDRITISSPVEFQEVLDSLDGATTLRFEIAQPSIGYPASSYPPSSVAESLVAAAAPPQDQPAESSSANTSMLPEPDVDLTLLDGYRVTLHQLRAVPPPARQESTNNHLGTLSPADSLIHLEEEQYEQIEFFSEGSDTESEEEDGGSVSDTTDVQIFEGKGKEKADVAEPRRSDFGFVDDDSEEEEEYKSLAAAIVGVEDLKTSMPPLESTEPDFNAEDPHNEPLATTPPAPASDDPPEDALPSSSTPLTDDASTAHTNAQQPPYSPHGGLPPSLAAFLTSLPTHAEALSTNLTTFLNHPSSDTLSALLSVPSAPLGQIPSVARGVQSEVQAAISELVGSVRREARGLQEEFGRIQREVGEERERMREELRRAWEEPSGPGAGEKDDVKEEVTEEEEEQNAAAAEPVAQEEVHVEDRQHEASSTPAAELNAIGESARLAAQKLEEAREEVRRVAREMRRKEREARKAREHQARHSRRSSKASKAELKEAIKAAGDDAAPALDDSTASVEVPIVEAIRPSTATPSVDLVARPEDDMYRRRISMPGSFAPTPSPPVALTPSPPVAPYAFAPRLPPASGQPPLPPLPPLTGSVKGTPRYRLPPSPSTYTPTLLRPLSVPGSFPTSSFSTSPTPLPQASTSTLPDDGEWAEVTPTQLKKQLAELGFDLKDVGTRGAAERVWEAKRGKSLGEMVDAVVEMLVKRSE